MNLEDTETRPHAREHKMTQTKAWTIGMLISLVFCSLTLLPFWWLVSQKPEVIYPSLIRATNMTDRYKCPDGSNDICWANDSGGITRVRRYFADE